jgi:hypothetical protein
VRSREFTLDYSSSESEKIVTCRKCEQRHARTPPQTHTQHHTTQRNATMSAYNSHDNGVEISSADGPGPVSSQQTGSKFDWQKRVHPALSESEVRPCLQCVHFNTRSLHRVFGSSATLQHATPRCTHECARTRCTTVLSAIHVVATSNTYACCLPVCVLAIEPLQASKHSATHTAHDHVQLASHARLSVGRQVRGTLAEFIGSLLFVFFGVGSVVATKMAAEGGAGEHESHSPCKLLGCACARWLAT